MGGKWGCLRTHTHTHVPSLFQLQVSGPRASPHTGHEQVCCRAVGRERVNLLAAGGGGQEPQCVCVCAGFNAVFGGN